MILRKTGILNVSLSESQGIKVRTTSLHKHTMGHCFDCYSSAERSSFTVTVRAEPDLTSLRKVGWWVIVSCIPSLLPCHLESRLPYLPIERRPQRKQHQAGCEQ